MRVFAIRSEDDIRKKDLAYLLYYEKEKRFYIELPDDADVWETPLILDSFLKRGQKTINSYWSLKWVQQRIIPTDRQNLGQILKDNEMEEYDEFQLLIAGEGRCAQDDYYLFEISEEHLLNNISERYEKRLEDVVPLKNGYLLSFFRDGSSKKVNIRRLLEYDARFSRIMKEQELFNTVKLQPGGYGVCWDEHLTVPDYMLYDEGEELFISLDDFRSFASNRVVNTAEAMDILDCSRQNVNDLIKRGKIEPIKKEAKSTLFLKSDIEQRLWH